MPNSLRLEILRFNKDKQIEELKSLIADQDKITERTSPYPRRKEFKIEGVFEGGTFKAEYEGIKLVLRREPEQIESLEFLLEGIKNLKELLPFSPLAFPLEFLFVHSEADFVLFCSEDRVVLIEFEPRKLPAIVFTEAKRVMEGIFK